MRSSTTRLGRSGHLRRARRVVASVVAGAIAAAGLVGVTATPAAAVGGTPWTTATGAVPGGEWQSVAAGDGVVVATGTWNPTVAGTVMRSVDGGETWSAVTVPGLMTGWTGLATDGDDRFVAVGYNMGQNPAVIVSTDGGQTWTAASGLPAIAGYWRAISYAGNDTFVAVGDGNSGSTATVMRSTDGGITWALAADATSPVTESAWTAVGFGGGTLMAVGTVPSTSAPTIMTSTDGGDHWAAATAPPASMTPTLTTVGYNAGRWVVAGVNGGSAYASAVMTSDDNGQTWTAVVDADIPEYVYDVAFGGGVWIAMAAYQGYPPYPVVLRSTDNGLTWSTEVTPSDISPNAVQWSSVTFAVTSWVAVGVFAQGGAKQAMTAPGLDPALTPTFDTPVDTQGGFTVNVTNYDSTWTWTPSVDTGTVTAGTASGATLPLTVTGLQPGSSATVTVGTTKSGHLNGTATVNGTSAAALPQGIVPNVSNTESLPASTTVWVDNYDPAYTWTVTSTAGTVGAVTAAAPYAYWTVTGLTGGQTVTVTVATSRTGFSSESTSTSASAAPAVAAPSLGTPESVSGGFKVEIVDYAAADTYTVSSSAGSATRSGRWVTVSGLSSGASATLTVTRSSTGLTDASSTTTGTAATPGLVPVLDTPVRTATGFTVNVTNYDSAYTWTLSVTSGTATAGTASGATLPVTVTGLTPNQYADLLVRARRTGYTTEETSVTGNALGTALTPTFEPVVRTADGFTVVVDNVQSGWSVSGVATNGGVVALGTQVSQKVPVTLSGLTPATASTLTVTFTRSGFADGTASVTATSLNAGLVPVFGTVTRTSGGFTVDVTNYDAAYTWTPSVDNGTVTAGTPSGSTLPLTVTGLGTAASATVTVATTRTGYADGSATSVGSSLQAGRVPAFTAVSASTTGFVVKVTNYDAAWTWTPTVDNGAVTAGTPSGSTLTLTVTGLTIGQSAMVTVDTSRTGYADGTGTFFGSALPAGLTPVFGTPVATATGFTVNVTNYDAAYTWTPTVDNGTVTAGTPSGSTLPLTVTGLGAAASATVTMTTSKSGVADTSATVGGMSLSAARTPAFGTPTPTATGFTVNVTNWDAAWTWTPSVTGGFTVTAGTPANGKLLLTIAGMTPGQTTTLTVDTTRAGYVDGTASLTAGALPAGLDPVFGTPVPTQTGFTVDVTNYDAAYTWTPTVDNGTVTAGTASGSTLPLTVTGLTLGQSATVTVVTTKTGVAAGTMTVTGTTLTPGLVATFDTPVPTTTGYTVNVTNHDGSWTWSYAVDRGTVTVGTASGATLPLTVAGIGAGNTATVTVTTSKATFADASSTVSGTTLPIGTVPSFGPTVTRTATGFVVEIANYDPLATGITWNVSVTPGTATFDPLTGTVTVTGVPAGASATLTVTTSEAGKADTEATVAGQALPTAGGSGASSGSSGSGSGASGGSSSGPAKPKPAASSAAPAPQPVVVSEDGLPRVRPGGIVVTVGGQSVAAVSSANGNRGRCDGTPSGTQIVASVDHGALQVVCGAPASASWAAAFRSVAPGGQLVPVVVDPFTTVGLSPLLLVRGGTIAMHATGIKPGADVNLFAYTSGSAKVLAHPMLVGRLVAGADGAVDGTLTVPASIAADDYVIQLVTADRADRQVAVTMPVEVRDAAPTARVVTARTNVRFAAGSSVLTPRARAQLGLLAAQVRAGQAGGATVRLLVRGYAMPGTGKALVSRRLTAVRGYLLRTGLKATITRQALVARPGGVKPGRVVTTVTLTGAATTSAT